MKKEGIYYRYELNRYLTEFGETHNKEEVLNEMKDIIEMKSTKTMPAVLKYADKKVLSKELSSLILSYNDYYKPEEREYDFTSLIPVIEENKLSSKLVKKLKIVKENINRKTTYALNRTEIKGIISLVLFTTAISAAAASSSKTEYAAEVNNKVSINKEIDNNEEAVTIDVTKLNYPMGGILKDALEKAEQEEIKERELKREAELKRLAEEKKKLEKEKKKKEEEEKKRKEREKILNNYKALDTLEDIFTREKELKSLGLTDDDKIYKNCPASAEIQRFTWEQSQLHGYPAKFSLSIDHTETRGQFNASGIAVYNASNNSYDLGYTQQNTKGPVKIFCSKYGVSYEEAVKLVRYNDFANIACAFLAYEEIDKHFNSFEPENFAGCYNGWLNWRNKPTSREYVEIFSDAYYNEYTEYNKEMVKK